jgi:predicted aspartyl protease
MISVERMAERIGRALAKRKKQARYWKALATKRAARIELLRVKLGAARVTERHQAAELRAFRRRQMKLPLA